MVKPALGTALRAALLGSVCMLTGAASAQTATVVERGRVLMDGIVACGHCHMARGPQGQPLPEKGMSGGLVFDEPPFRAVAPNITPDANTGIGKWTDAQLGKAIREGLRPDGSLIGPPMPIALYRHLGDTDLVAIVAYLRAQPAVSNATGKSVYRIPLPPNYGPPIESVVAPPDSDELRYGEYLASIGHCMTCHTPMGPEGRPVKGQFGAGGTVFSGPWGQSVARNLTPHASGLKGWTDAEIARAIRSGVSKDGSKLKPPMGFNYYKNIGDADMAALIVYLRSLKPLEFGGKG